VPRLADGRNPLGGSSTAVLRRWSHTPDAVSGAGGQVCRSDAGMGFSGVRT
jgi:hypothetical protein